MHIKPTQLIKVSLESLGIYRDLLTDLVIDKLYLLIDFVEDNSQDYLGVISRYNEFYYALMTEGNGISLKDYIIKKIIFHDNVYGRLVQRCSLDKLDKQIYEATKEDLGSLYNIACFTPDDIIKSICFKDNESSLIVEKINNLYKWDMSGENITNYQYSNIISKFQQSTSWKECIDDLTQFHKQSGSGIWSEFKGFIWEGEKLEGVVSLDPIRLSDLIGYEIERQKVVDNTLAFLKGYPANNVLLYGSRGTGKSSTVKALLNEYHNEGLRIIEISKRHLESFPKVIRKIKKYPQKFILFIDDLSFEDNDGAYTALKAVLEGGLETRPDNVVIYATSNRRHFVKEKFSDRAGILSGNKDDEVRAIDTMQEKLSLADRFGITVTFTSPNQKQYLDIVDGLVESRKIKIDKEELHRKAIQWEMWYNARSPRTAKQFVDWLEGSL